MIISLILICIFTLEKRITSGPDQNYYYHEYFLRGNVDLCRQVSMPGVIQKYASNNVKANFDNYV